MYLARIIGNLVATVKQDTLEKQTLQWIQPIDASERDRGSALVAVDPIGLGPGELCYYITAREASLTLRETFVAVDAGIVGKVDRIDLDDPPIGLIALNLGRVCAGDVLIPAKAGHVGVELCQVAAHGLDLADLAAELALLERLVEEVHPLVANHLLHVLGAREEDLDLLAVAVAHAFDEVVGGLGQATGVQHEHPGGGVEPVHHIQIWDLRHGKEQPEEKS